MQLIAETVPPDCTRTRVFADVRAYFSLRDRQNPAAITIDYLRRQLTRYSSARDGLRLYWEFDWRAIRSSINDLIKACGRFADDLLATFRERFDPERGPQTCDGSQGFWNLRISFLIDGRDDPILEVNRQISGAISGLERDRPCPTRE